MAALATGVAASVNASSTGGGSTRATHVKSTQATAAHAGRAAAGKSFHIYFATFAIANSFWAPMHQGAIDAGKQTGDKVTWTQGTEFSTPETVKRMQVALAAHPDAIVVTDLVPTAFEPIMKKAQKEGILVVNANAASPNKNPPYLMYIGANEFLAGQVAAQQTLTQGTPKRAGCMNPVLASVALADRCRGYKSVLAPKGTKVDVVDVSGSPSETASKMQGYLTAHSDATAAYELSADPAFLTPMQQAIKATHRKLTLVTNDTSSAVFDAIKAGAVLGTIGQQQYLQGYLPVIFADLYLRYGFISASKEVLTGPFFINKGNVDRINTLVKQGIQ